MAAACELAWLAENNRKCALSTTAPECWLAWLAENHREVFALILAFVGAPHVKILHESQFLHPQNLGGPRAQLQRALRRAPVYVGGDVLFALRFSRNYPTTNQPTLVEARMHGFTQLELPSGMVTGLGTPLRNGGGAEPPWMGGPLGDGPWPANVARHLERCTETKRVLQSRERTPVADRVFFRLRDLLLVAGSWGCVEQRGPQITYNRIWTAPVGNSQFFYGVLPTHPPALGDGAERETCTGPAQVRHTCGPMQAHPLVPHPKKMHGGSSPRGAGASTVMESEGRVGPALSKVFHVALHTGLACPAHASLKVLRYSEGYGFERPAEAGEDAYP